MTAFGTEGLFVALILKNPHPSTANYTLEQAADHYGFVRASIRRHGIRISGSVISWMNNLSYFASILFIESSYSNVFFLYPRPQSLTAWSSLALDRSCGKLISSFATADQERQGWTRFCDWLLQLGEGKLSAIADREEIRVPQHCVSQDKVILAGSDRQNITLSLNDYNFQFAQLLHWQ